MQTRKFDELISYFNRKVAEMSIDTKHKMELLGMVTALGFAHEEELTIQPEQRWIPVTKEEMFKAGYEGREIRFRVDGRLFAIRELAQ